MKTWRLTKSIVFAFIGLQTTSGQAFKSSSPLLGSESHSAESLDFFEKKIRPLLANNCYNCHSANTNSQGGLRLDDRNGQLTGGNSGPALAPGDIEKSLLIQVVQHADGVPKMPPKKKLTDEQIDDLKKWVADGAAWPSPVAPADINNSHEEYESLRATHWAWQPIQKPNVPAVQDAGWPRDDIDRFIQSEIEEKQLVRAIPADRVSLIRRVTFDLTGLPPTPEEINDFIQDSSEHAYESVVDRLLASSGYSERWGRHWLDVARYGESTGSSRNLPTPHAWRYRDYVLKSFAQDKPFDRFIKEQIAGDLLPADSEEAKEELVTATGLLAIGVKDVNQRYKVRFDMDNVDEQIDVVTRGFLGVTASCARCHDHKFDPVPTNDYYALAGIFKSTDICAGLRNKMGGGGIAYYDTDKLIVFGQGSVEMSDETKAKIEEAKKTFEDAQKEFNRLRNDPAGDEKAPNGRPRRQVARQKMNRANQALLALSDPSKNGRVIQGVREAKEIGDTEIRYRGEAEELGPKVHRGFLSLASFDNQPTINPNQSGRLELAEWIANNNNPLTSRVISNRVWKYLFGRGIVSTVDNFGINGDRPTHPELLDHLALKFQQDGWSIKKLVRSLVLTQTYQLGSEHIAANNSIDPENLYLWRHSPRRLDAEEIRDATLVAAGALDLSPPKASPAKDLPVMEIRNNGKEAKTLHEFSNASKQRSVYLPLVRGITPQSLEVFDFAEQGTVVGARSVTTVPPQSLYLLNDAFVRNNSLLLAQQLLSKSDINDDDRVQLAYQVILNRSANSNEIVNASLFIEDAHQISELIRDLKKSSDGEGNKPKGNSLAMVGTSSAVTNEQIDGQSVADVSVPDVTTATAQVASTTPDAATTTPNAAPADGSKPKLAPVIDPDQILTVEELPEVVVLEPNSPREAAWANFTQALFGSGEFRYLK